MNELEDFYQATKDPQWVNAMKEEIKALEENKTWEPVQLLPRKKPIECRWVYKIKYKPNGEMKRFKTRLVAKGYS